jgi:hypothetical protein
VRSPRLRATARPGQAGPLLPEPSSGGGGNRTRAMSASPATRSGPSTAGRWRSSLGRRRAARASSSERVAQASAEGSDHVLAGEGGRLRGQPVRAGEPVEHPRHRALAERLITVARSTGHLADELVGVAAALSRLGPPRAYKVSGASCALALRVAWTAHCTSRGVRARPMASRRSTSAVTSSARWENPATAQRASPGTPGCPTGPRLSTRPRASGSAPAGRPPGRPRRPPAGAGTDPGHPTPSSGRPDPGRGWRPPGGYATADHPRAVRWSNPTAGLANAPAARGCPRPAALILRRSWATCSPAAPPAPRRPTARTRASWYAWLEEVGEVQASIRPSRGCEIGWFDWRGRGKPDQVG